MTTPEDVENAESSKYKIVSNRLEDILQCSQGLGQRIVVTSATYPYHVEWINSEWSKACGWQSDEILGLDCKFLQGDVTDQRKVANFMTKLFSTGGYSDLKVLNYHKDNTLLQNSIRCFPVIDNCGPDFSAQVSHIAAVLVQSKEFTLSEEDMGLMEDWHLKEVGMPIDRREGCHIYPHCNSLPPPSALEWRILTESLPLALMLRYMLRSQAPIVLTDREDRIVHVNVSWVNLTGYSALYCEGKVMSSLFHHTGDEKSLQSFHDLVEKCKRNDLREGAFSDESTNQNSAYSTDTESSDDSQFVSLPRSANIVLAPPTNIFKSSSSSSSGSFQLNPWGSCKVATRPRLPLTVSPAAIKLKHLAYLFSESLPPKAEKTLKTESMDSPPVTRKRPKSATAQCAYSTSTLPGQRSSSLAPTETGSTTSTSSNLPFGRPAWYTGGGEAATSDVAPTSSCESARKLLKCSSLPAQSGSDQSALAVSLMIPIPILPRTPPISETATRFAISGEMNQGSVSLPPDTKANFTSNIER